MTYAYAGAAARLGVKFLKYTEATGIVTEKMRLRAVKTAAGDISTAVVLNAAGAYAGKVAAMAGLALPIRPERHEVLVTEPVNPLQGP